MNVVLASSSPYRKELLGRLRIPFSVAVPAIDESALAGETPGNLALRLAQAKAAAVANEHTNALVIASDQVAVCEDRILGKPLTALKAIQQLTSLSGREVTFLTGLVVLNTKTQQMQAECISYQVIFRRLTAPQIQRYVELDNPVDCAGSFKSEGLGIALFESMQGDDPTALIGLPLIRLVSMLANEGVDVLSGRCTCLLEGGQAI